MRSLTDARPKCLVTLRGKALLDWQLAALRAAGIDEIAIVSGYRAELLVRPGVTRFHNPRWAETNMVSSLACAGAWLCEAPCIVSYSDIFYDASAVRSLIDSTASLAVTFDPGWLALWRERFSDPLVDAETFRLKPDGMLAEIGQKPQTIEEVEGQYMGLLRFTPEGWAETERVRAALAPAQRDKMHMTGTLQRIIQAGRVPIAAIPYAGPWGEVDTEDDLAVYNRV